MNLAYLRFDLRRMVRNKRLMIFSILMPLVLFLVFGTHTEGARMDTGITAVAYVMVSMAMFGSMSAAMSSGGAIATERDGGWNRTLRLTPLKPYAYVASKVLLSLVLAIAPLVAVFVAGVAAGGVRLDADQWTMVALTSWLGALPFAGLGLIIGYVATPDSVQPITGLTTMMVAAFGGLWLPVENMPRRDARHRPADPGVLDRPDRAQHAHLGRDRQPRPARRARLDADPRLHRAATVPRRHRSCLELG